MTRLNLSELAKQRLEKSHLRYEYKHDNNEQKYNINMKRSIIWDAAINREKWMNMTQFERYEYANNKKMDFL